MFTDELTTAKFPASIHAVEKQPRNRPYLLTSAYAEAQEIKEFAYIHTYDKFLTFTRNLRTWGEKYWATEAKNRIWSRCCLDHQHLYAKDIKNREIFHEIFGKARTDRWEVYEASGLWFCSLSDLWNNPFLAQVEYHSGYSDTTLMTESESDLWKGTWLLWRGDRLCSSPF